MRPGDWMKPKPDVIDLKPCQWARWLLRSGEFVVIDSETTGLEDDAAMVSLAVVESDGTVLFDSLLNPGKPMGATFIHGLTDDDVKDAPTFAQVFPQIRRALINRRWVIYNRDYDTARLEYECRRYGLLYPTPAQYGYTPVPRIKEAYGFSDRRDDVHCAMLHYADHYGDWSDYHGNYKWQKLVVAAAREGIATGQAHHALGDALTTLNLIQKLAWKEDREDNDEETDDGAA